MNAISRRDAALAVVACLFVAFEAIWLAGYRVNLTPSLPKGIYRLSATPLQRGDFVAFCLEGEFAELARERGYLQAGSCPSGLRPLLKKVAGLPGDTINMSRMDGFVTVEIGKIVLATGDKPLTLAQLWKAPLYIEDSKGRYLPSELRNGVIPPSKALVLAEHPGSFDSRYFGLVPLETLGRVEPVFLFPEHGELQ